MRLKECGIVRSIACLLTAGFNYHQNGGTPATLLTNSKLIYTPKLANQRLQFLQGLTGQIVNGGQRQMLFFTILNYLTLGCNLTQITLVREIKLTTLQMYCQQEKQLCFFCLLGSNQETHIKANNSIYIILKGKSSEYQQQYQDLSQLHKISQMKIYKMILIIFFKNCNIRYQKPKQVGKNRDGIVNQFTQKIGVQYLLLYILDFTLKISNR